MGLYEILNEIQKLQNKLLADGKQEAYKEWTALYRKLCRPMMHIGGDTIGTAKEVVKDMMAFRKGYPEYTEVNILLNSLSRFAEKGEI